MAKVMVCDICKKQGKLTECRTYKKVKNMPELRIDFCNSCEKSIPNNMTQYIIFCFGLMGQKISEEDVKKMYSGRIIGI